MRKLIDSIVYFGRIVSQRAGISLPTAVAQDDDAQRDINRPQPYGIATYPPDGSTVVGVAPNGNAENTIAVLTYNKEASPVDLAEGDVVMFTSRGGQEIRMTVQNGEIQISGESVRINNVFRITQNEAFIRVNEREVSLNDFIALHTHTSTAPGTQTGLATLS